MREIFLLHAVEIGMFWNARGVLLIPAAEITKLCRWMQRTAALTEVHVRKM